MSNPLRAQMTQKAWLIAATVLVIAAISPALAADREQPRIVVNLIGGIKAPFGPKLEGEKTERTWRIGDGGVGACLRHENRRWCYEHFPAAGLRMEMLQISVEPLEEREGRPAGPWQYATDYDLDGVADLGGYKMRGPLPAPTSTISSAPTRIAARITKPRCRPSTTRVSRSRSSSWVIRSRMTERTLR